MITSNVAKIMKKRGVTIRKMVAATGLSDTTILRARCGQINQCRVYTLEIIARFLECDVKDLFNEEKPLEPEMVRTKWPEPQSPPADRR